MLNSLSFFKNEFPLRPVPFVSFWELARLQNNQQPLIALFSLCLSFQLEFTPEQIEGKA